MGARECGRVFVCGDIHGCFDELMAKLDEIDFDRSCDRVYALGDLVDRGPKSAEVVRLLDEPWFESVIGNHEVMMIAAYRGKAGLHRANGGTWFANLEETERAGLIERVRILPIAITVRAPSGRRIGLVHADVPNSDWNAFIKGATSKREQNYALWARERVQHALNGKPLLPIANIDHVYFGHTPVPDVLRSANMSWIDTGCFKTGRITIEELF